MSKFDLEYLITTKKVKYNDTIDFEFKALTSEDFLRIFNEFPEFITFLFKDVNILSKEEYANDMMLKFSEASKLMIALCECSEDVSLDKKLNAFKHLDICFTTECLVTVLDLTFKDDMVNELKKLEANIQKAIETFFKMKGSQETMENSQGKNLQK